MTGLHKKIEYSFMTVGHTKFSCDRSFGVLKQKNHTELRTLYDIAKSVNESGECNSAELVGYHNGKVSVKAFDWAEENCYSG